MEYGLIGLAAGLGAGLVTMGAAMGIDLDNCFDEVHASNMSKLQNGKVLYSETGKVLKGKDYFEPELDRLLIQHTIGQP